jgi:5-methylcytosine-specific restriction endonuclease McrA
MSLKKKQIRANFRAETFARDHLCCRICGNKDDLDAHHIQNRNLFKNGGYTKFNGISLCPTCHLKAEHFHQTGESLEGFSPTDLYQKIGSSFELAIEKDAILKV